MRNFRAVFAPLLVLCAACGLAMLSVRLEAVVHFDFIWDVLLGAALGILLALLPTFAGFGGKHQAVTSMLWVCGFAALLLIFYQYASMVTGWHMDAISFLSSPGPRLRIAEGAVLGYCSLIAGRGKV